MTYLPPVLPFPCWALGCCPHVNRYLSALCRWLIESRVPKGAYREDGGVGVGRRTGLLLRERSDRVRAISFQLKERKFRFNVRKNYFMAGVG